MGVYIFLLSAVCLLWTLCNKVQLKAGNRVKFENLNKIYAVSVGGLFFLFAALRNYTVGRDMNTYLNRYVRLAGVEWKNIFRMADSMSFEHGFAVINKLLSYISDNPRLLLVAGAFFIVFSFSFAIYRNSPIPWLSFFLFMTNGFYGSSMNTMRQYIAVSIIIFSYEAIKKDQFIKFIILILLASWVHTSAIIVLPMYWLSKLKYNKITLFTILGVLVGGVYLFLRYPQAIVSLILPYILAYSKYFNSLETSVGNGAVGATCIYFVFLLLIIKELYKSGDKARNMYIAFAIISAILVLCSFVVGISARMLPYFTSMYLFSIPKAIVSEREKRIQIQYLVVICAVMLIYYLAIICRANTGKVIPYELWDNTYRTF